MDGLIIEGSYMTYDIDNENLQNNTENVPSAPVSQNKKEAEVRPDLSSDVAKCRRIIEAVLFAAGHPMEYSKLADTLGTSVGTVKKIVADYAEEYNSSNMPERGVILVMYPDTCQLCTKEEYGLFIRYALGIRRGGNLSASSLEVLAIIAYNQPVTRAYVDTVRGVDSSYTVSSLVDKHLIESCGRLDVPGHPHVYRTTDDFLRVFGLSSLNDLPPVPRETVPSEVEEENAVITDDALDDGTKGSVE